MGIFQRLNMERGITVLLITHEMDIAEYGTRLVRFRDGRIQIDRRSRIGATPRRSWPRCRRPRRSRMTAPSDTVAVEHLGGVV